MTNSVDAATVREAVEDDLEAVLDVGRRTWPVTYGPIAGDDYVAMGLAKWWSADATLPAIRRHRVLVACVDGRVVGVASAGPMDGHFVLWKLYVPPEHQGGGLGGRLLDAVVDRVAEEAGALRLSYLDGNVGAEKFYRRHGFVEVSRESGGSGRPDSVWMERHIRVAGPRSTTRAPLVEESR